MEDTEGDVSPDQKVVAKFLVSNAAAGSVIGKAGSNIGGVPSLTVCYLRCTDVAFCVVNQAYAAMRVS